MGTFVEIAVVDAPLDVDRLAAVDAAFDAMATVAACMSFHDAGSALSRLNAAGAGERVACHPWLVDVLRFSRELHEASGGLFDPGIGDVLEEAALLPRHPQASRLDDRRSSILDLEVVDATSVRVVRPLRLDLGGVAKGFAVDRAIEALAAAGVIGAVVDAGGDLRVLGAPQDIHLRTPAGPLHLGRLGDGAVATSSVPGASAATRTEAVRGLVDPHRHALAGGGSVSVLAPTCMVADALTKVALLAGGLPEACARRYDARSIAA